jgi:glycogen synthase
VIHNAIEEDKNKITPIDEIQLARKQKYYCVGNVGRLAKQKGMGYFVNAIPYILKEN